MDGGLGYLKGASLRDALNPDQRRRSSQLEKEEEEEEDGISRSFPRVLARVVRVTDCRHHRTYT